MANNYALSHYHLTFVGIDLVGPLHEVNGKKYIATAICYFSKYVEAQAIGSKNATEIADFLFGLISQYGIFQRVHSDQGDYRKLKKLEVNQWLTWVFIIHIFGVFFFLLFFILPIQNCQKPNINV